MILDERTETFLVSLDAGNPAYLSALEKKAHQENVPVIRPLAQSFLKTVLAAKKPKRILEVGCAVGFSALLMAENTPADTKITTIEKDPARAAKARENFRRAG